jgi:Ni/Co efflux regulator RcnB
MKSTLLLSASAVLCLLWPAVSLAEPQHGGGEAGGGHAQGGGQPHGGGQAGHAQAGHASMSRASGGSARPTPRASVARATSTRSHMAHVNATPARQNHLRAIQGRTRVAQGGAPTTARNHASAATAHSRDAAAMQGVGRHAELNRNVQARHAFQAGAYRQPQGYEQRHWGFGERLPTAYYARDYWLTDFALYGLFGPPEGLVWVRVGPDALLIDQSSGEIVQVDYGVFY